MTEKEATEEELKVCAAIQVLHFTDEGVIYLRAHVQKEIDEQRANTMSICEKYIIGREQQAVEKAMDEYYIRIITAFRDERKIKEVVKERIEKEKKQKGRHGAMITIAPILEYIDALYFAESCARIARWHDARADEKSDECKSIIAAGSDSNQAKAATNPDREHSGNSSLSMSEQQAVEKAMGELREEVIKEYKMTKNRPVYREGVAAMGVLIDARYPNLSLSKSDEKGEEK